MSYLELAHACTPEIAMTVLAIAVLLLDVTLLRGQDPDRRARLLGAVSIAGLLGVLALIVGWLVAARASGLPLYFDPARIVIVDGLTLSLRAVVVVTTIGTILVSIGYELTRHVGEFLCLTLFAAVGMSFLVSTENALMFLVGVELLSICLYVLTGLHKGLVRSAEGAVKYFMIGALSSAFLLFGLSYVVGLTGTAELRDMGEAVRAMGREPPLLLFVGLVFVLVGLGFKVAVVPFHAWAPDAYEGAPTPVTAFIATGSKVASFVVGAKILLLGFPSLIGSARVPFSTFFYSLVVDRAFVMGWAVVLALAAVASMVWGNAAALSQTNIKRMLAYSSIAHAGYILVALVAGTREGMTAILYYLVAYALTNLGAFGVVSALTRAAGGDDLEDFDGMVQRAPGMSLMLLVFVLSLAGIPPLAGFFGKFYLFAAAVEADRAGLGLLWLVAIGIATSAVSLYYYLVLLKHVFVLAPRRVDPVVVPAALRAGLAVVALAVVAVGAAPQPLVDLFSDEVRSSRVVGR